MLRNNNNKKIPLPHFILFQWTGCKSGCELRGGGFWVVAQHEAFFCLVFFLLAAAPFSSFLIDPVHIFGLCEQVCIFSVFPPPSPSMSGVEMYFGKLKLNTLNAGCIYSAASVRDERNLTGDFCGRLVMTAEPFGRVWFCCVSPGPPRRSSREVQHSQPIN